jgi:hypothetical protein
LVAATTSATATAGSHNRPGASPRPPPSCDRPTGSHRLLAVTNLSCSSSRSCSREAAYPGSAIVRLPLPARRGPTKEPIDGRPIGQTDSYVASRGRRLPRGDPTQRNDRLMPPPSRGMQDGRWFTTSSAVRDDPAPWRPLGPLRPWRAVDPDEVWAAIHPLLPLRRPWLRRRSIRVRTRPLSSPGARWGSKRVATVNKWPAKAGERPGRLWLRRARR